MAKQTFTTGQVLTAAQMTSLQQTAMLGGDASVKVANYTLVAADAGTTVAMNSASTTTITVNTGLFAAGDTVFIQNRGAGVCTVTAGTATVASAGSLALPENDAGILYFTSASAATFYDFIQAASASAFVGCQVQFTGTQSIANDAYTAVTWNTENFDTDAMHSLVTNTSRITIASGKDGYYWIYGFVNYENQTGRRILAIRKNGAETIGFEVGITASSPNTNPCVGVYQVLDLDAGDYLELFTYQNSGGSINIASFNQFGAYKIG